MTRLKVFYDDQWQHLPAKTRVEYTYEWEGEPHASPSVKRAGDGIVARNLGDNPTTSGTTGWRTNNTANWAIERVALDDHPEGLEQGYRSQAVLDGNHLGNVLSMYDIGGTRLPAEVSGHAYGVWVKVNVPSTTDSRYGSTPIMPDTWTYLTGFRDSYLTGMQILVDDPDDIGAAEAFTTGANIATADTEEEALAQVETYYDGGTRSHLGWQNFTPRVTGDIKRIWRQPTPPPAGTSYEWAGERHDSESIKRVDGEEVARNLANDPALVNAAFINGNRVDGVITQEGSTGSNNMVPSPCRDFEIGEPFSAGVWVTNLDYEGGRTVQQRIAVWDNVSYDTIGRGEYATIAPGETKLVKYEGFSPIADSHYVQPRLHGALEEGYKWAARDFMFNRGPELVDYFDGDTASDRANDLWYNADGVPHVWVNGQGWVAP